MARKETRKDAEASGRKYNKHHRKNIIIRPATKEEIDTYQKPHANNKLISIPCGNPTCAQKVRITEAEANKFNVTYPKQYGRWVFVYCSEQCQQDHLNLLKPN